MTSLKAARSTSARNEEIGVETLGNIGEEVDNSQVLRRKTR